jgi:DNA-binding winged helix-turn-helix (wHTH) protein/Tol biopolymer transport system component
VNEEIYKFEEFELDPAKRALLKNGRTVSLNPKAFDLLVHLVERQNEIISKDDLIERVWGGQFVEENNITVQISALRKVLGDSAKSAKFLKTIPGKGYKFIAAVENENNEEIVFEKYSISKVVLEEEETLTDTELAQKVPGDDTNLVKPRKFSPLAIFSIALIGLLLGIIFYQFYTKNQENKRYRIAKTNKLTTSGKITNLALTPNGEYTVFSQTEGDGESLWLKHLETGGQQQLISPQAASFVGLTVSPDGNFIYFSRFGNEAETYLERVSILGGVPEKITEVDTAVSVGFSPDSRKIAFTESHTARGETSLSISNVDGSSKKTLISATNDRRILATFQSNPVAWSPDGEVIAVAVEEKQTDGSSTMAVLLINPETGSEQVITEKRWKHAMELTWVDSENLAFYGFEEGKKQGDIWIVSRKTGDYYQLTDDPNFYQRLTGTDGKLLAIKGNEVSRIKTVDFADDLRSFKLKEVFNESGHIGNIAWSNDSSILYTSASGGQREIWKIDAEEKKPVQLTVNSDVTGGISVSPKDKQIVFTADKGGFSTLWLADSEGKNLSQLTFNNEDDRASWAENGESIIFQRGATFGKQTLWRIDVKTKDLRQITKTHTSHPQVSSDGRKTAYYFMDEETDKRWRIGIVDNQTGEIITKINFPVVVNQRRLKWHPTSEFLTQVIYEGEDASLLFLPVNGGEHKIISGFGKGEIISLDWTADGKKLLFSQVNEIRDVVSFEFGK